MKKLITILFVLLAVISCAQRANTGGGGMIFPSGIGIPVVSNGAWGTTITNNIPISYFNSGTNASSSTYWRGDGTWGTPSGSFSYPSGNGFVQTTGSAWGTTIAATNVVYFGSAITGTPSASTYLRGDGSWQSLPASGDMFKSLYDNTGTTDIIDVENGGTGLGTFTAYAPLVGGTTTTGNLQQATTGMSTSGYVFTSNGVGAIPSFQEIPWQTLSIDSTSTTIGISILNGNRVNFNKGAGTITGSGTSGRVTLWDGTSSITSDADFTMDGTDVTTTGLFKSDATTVQSLSGTSITMNTQSGLKGTLTLSGNTTLTISNLVDGFEGLIEITNGSSAYTLDINGSTGYTTEKVMGSKSAINSTTSSHTTVVYWRTGSTLYYGFIFDN